MMGISCACPISKRYCKLPYCKLPKQTYISGLPYCTALIKYNAKINYGGHFMCLPV